MSKGGIYLYASSKTGECASIQVDWVGRRFRVMEWGIVVETGIPRPRSISHEENTSVLAVSWKVTQWIYSCWKRGLTLREHSLEWESRKAK